MGTILAFNTGKAIMEDAKIKILIDHLPHIGPEEPVLFRKPLVIP
jgi:hypothetical protein